MGCLWPIIRNFLLTGLAMLTGIIVCLATGRLGYGALAFLGVTAVHGYFWHVYWKPNDDRVRRAIFGLDPEQ
jgi:hypothetical protein